MRVISDLVTKMAPIVVAAALCSPPVDLDFRWKEFGRCSVFVT